MARSIKKGPGDVDPELVKRLENAIQGKEVESLLDGNNGDNNSGDNGGSVDSDDVENEEFGLASALSDAMEATIAADVAAAEKCLSMIEKFAFSEKKSNSMSSMLGSNDLTNDLKMESFTMRNSAGELQELSIPKLTMMPLPLLHVKEASFDFDLNMEVSETVEKEAKMDSGFKGHSLKRVAAVPKLVLKRVPKALSSASQTEGESKSSTTHVKAVIKMEQSDLPAGIKTLLQAAANSFIVKNKKEE